MSQKSVLFHNSGGVGRVKKHEIYAAAFGDHLFDDLVLQGQGSHAFLDPPPPDPLLFPAGCSARSSIETGWQFPTIYVQVQVDNYVCPYLPSYSVSFSPLRVP